MQPLALDVDDPNSIAKAAAEVSGQYKRLDVLINNAGINYDTWETAENADIDGTVMETVTTNLLGPWRVGQAFVPLLRKSRAGRIVNVSSESGSGGRPVAEGAAGIVWAATLPDDGPTGGFFQDRKPLPW